MNGTNFAAYQKRKDMETLLKKDLLVLLLKPVITEIAEKVAEKLEPTIKEPKKVEQKFYSRDEVCELLHISLPTLKKYTDNGTLHGVKMGERRVLYDASEIENLINNNIHLRYKR